MATDSIGSRLKRAWNAFLNRDPTTYTRDMGSGYAYQPYRTRLARRNERTIITSIFNRIALDVAAVDIRHVQLDDKGRYVRDIDSDLNNCLQLEANIDQTSRAFIQDAVMSMLDEGAVALVPVDTTLDPTKTDSYDIESMRTGKILTWYPRHVRVKVYNDHTGRKEELVLPKSQVSIIENPLYAVINESNSTLQRLIHKLNLLDILDEQNSSGKLDLIIQLPYVIKTKARRDQAEERRKDIEQQLAGSKYGIAYTDGTEHITQLNRSVDNNLQSQIEYLTSMLYSQLGITTEILNGTADDKTMLNYYDRTIEPILSAITVEMKRKFLTKTARSQHKSIMFFRDPFKLVPVSDLAEIADKMTRNEIMTSNEIRQVIGMQPSSDPNADKLRNKNLSEPSGANQIQNGQNENLDPDQELSELDDLDSQLSDLEASLAHSTDYLEHYASPYYDPVKAHEYYMRTRQLKGTSSNKKSLNDAGKEAKEYVSNQLNEEYKKKVSDVDSGKSESLNNDNVARIKSSIDLFRSRLENMSDSQREKASKQLTKMISLYKKAINKRKQTLKRSLNEEYKMKKTEEINKITSDSKFQKATNTRKKK